MRTIRQQQTNAGGRASVPGPEPVQPVIPSPPQPFPEPAPDGPPLPEPHPTPAPAPGPPPSPIPDPDPGSIPEPAPQMVREAPREPLVRSGLFPDRRPVADRMAFWASGNPS